MAENSFLGMLQTTDINNRHKVEGFDDLNSSCGNNHESISDNS